MNVYDTVNQLASELKNSEEYVNYKMAKQVINMNIEFKKKRPYNKKKCRRERKKVRKKKNREGFLLLYFTFRTKAGDYSPTAMICLPP